VNRNQIFESGEAAGASGSFFFFSHDKRFIVKTMTDEELAFIDQILPRLFEHFQAYPESLLAKIYGVYTVEMKGYHAVNLILMGNTLNFSSKQDITRIYDLKGSLISRFVPTRAGVKSTSTLKDVNFLRNKQQLQEINLSEEDRLTIKF